MDHAVDEQRQVARLKEIRATRDQAALDEALQKLAQAAESDDNLIPLILDAVRARGTVQEISQALVPAFGLYQETSVL